MSEKIRILIVDDHTMIRVAIKNYFVNDDRIEIVEEAVNGEEALARLVDTQIDLVLTDISMPVMDGYELAGKIKLKYPELKVVALSMINESQQVKKMLETGVDGYILKNCDKEELKAGIIQVMNGEDYFSNSVAHQIAEALAKRKGAEGSLLEIPLSQREKEVLKLMMKEYSNGEIANELSISTRTVDAHRRNLMEKTGSKGLVGLVIYAIEKELV
ncbi:response regulator transcription factor [uncultured Roseivirga sp.]|uniref:response regulator transcription factor n=1 Tax=uncultured Roseivirga sp. TaxID=543088 RepID=UPI000D7AE22C|nr:response regulator transcription factor [uncultured Roseivirga sp.]PWL29248.1 MAG: DNA-binding response regulator [Roseivirga sp. XM-24bin3]